jgi:cysteinyl-tRNA synthetase
VPLQLFNTLTRTKEEFIPMNPPVAGMYCCGPTVYNFAHIGNLRSYLFEDTLRRTLKFNGFQVKHVMNITDVGHLESDADEGEDKMEKGAAREGMSVWDIARKYEDAFYHDTDRLNIERPEVSCRATEHVEEMIQLIERLIENGVAYVTPGAVYFDTSKFPTYADFARLDLTGQKAGGGGRVELLGEKKNFNDFALWFLNKPKHLMQWDSPWGRGYPGWHIECSAMSMKYLGETFDIHCGGVDHVSVHHTNEIAQSEGATGHQFVHYWLHGAWLIEADKGKMSKSNEEFLTLQVLIDRGFDPMAYRFFNLQAHYRSELRFSWEDLDAARTGLRRVYSMRPEVEPLSDPIAYADARTEALAALNDDLNTPQLVGTLFKYNSPKLWEEFDAVLGLRIREKRDTAEAGLPPEVQALVDDRNEARKAKEWAKSDSLRDELIALGYDVGDGPTGTTVKKRVV